MSYSPPGGPPHYNPYAYPPMPMYPNPFTQQQAPFPTTAARPAMPRVTPTTLESPSTTHQSASQQASRPTTAPASPGIPYIGARISLISNMNIRYEGTLYTIDPKEATVALQNVRCFGTEGRVSAQDEVSPSPHIYQFIIFRGKDIKDLHVCETPPRFVPPTQPPPPHDPAIVATGTVPSPFGAFPKQEGKEFGSETDKSQLPSTIPPTTTVDPKRDPQQDWAAATAAAAAVRQSLEDSKTQGEKPGTPGSGTKTIKSTGSGHRPLSSGAAPFHPAGTTHSPLQSKKSRSPGMKSPQSTSRTTGSEGGRIIPGSGGLTAPGVDYDGPGTGSYLRRRVDHPTLPAAIPQGEFDIQSSNARFNKDQFKEQVRKAATKKPEGTESSASESTPQPSETTHATGTKPEERKEGEGEVVKTDSKVAEPEPGETQSEDAKYNAKKSFYDNISTDRDVSQRRDMVIKRDAETFGEGSSRNFSYRGRRGRGRGGRGRGGGGGGRGGGGGSNYYNYNNNNNGRPPRKQNYGERGPRDTRDTASTQQSTYYRAVPRS